MMLFPALALALCAPLMAQTRATPPEGDEIIDVFAAEKLADDSPCLEVRSTGCVYTPAAGDGGLLIYLRGWWGQYRGSVPARMRTVSARTIFREVGLQRVADRSGLTVLVTGSSDVAVLDADVKALERAARRKFSRVAVAAHSGGFVGLEATLQDLPAIVRVVMLDDFYFDREPLTGLIAARVGSGAKCTGFVTTHNLDRWQKRFKPFVECPVDVFADDEHTAAVGRCLGSYLDKTTCL